MLWGQWYILWMEEILKQLVDGLSQSNPIFDSVSLLFIFTSWCRISFIHRSWPYVAGRSEFANAQASLQIGLWKKSEHAEVRLPYFVTLEMVLKNRPSNSGQSFSKYTTKSTSKKSQTLLIPKWPTLGRFRVPTTFTAPHMETDQLVVSRFQARGFTNVTIYLVVLGLKRPARWWLHRVSIINLWMVILFLLRLLSLVEWWALLSLSGIIRDSPYC